MTFARRVVSGAAQLALGNGLVRLLSIVTMPILTVWLSPEVYGVAALASTIVSLASVLALAGIDTSYLRAYHGTQPPTGALAEKYCWGFALMGALPAAILGALAWYAFGPESIEHRGALGIVIALGIAFSIVSTMSQGRALVVSRHRAMAQAVVVAGVIAAGTSLAIAFWRPDVMALLVPMLLGFLIPIVLLGTPSIAEFRRLPRLNLEEGVTLVKIGLAGIVTAPMYWLLTSSDRWFLQNYHGAETVGVYAIGYSIAIVGLMLNAALMSVWQPEAAREYECDDVRARGTLGLLMSRMVAAMAVIWLATAAAGGDVIRWLADERFHAAAAYIPYIAGGVLFYGVLRLATTGLLLTKQLKWAAVWWLAGGIVCVLLNLALVPTHGGLGAAVAQCVSFAFMACGILVTAQCKYHVHLEWVRLALTALAVLAAGFVLIPAWHASAPVSLLMKLPVGTAVASAVAWIMAPQLCLKGIMYVRRRAFL